MKSDTSKILLTYLKIYRQWEFRFFNFFTGEDLSLPSPHMKQIIQMGVLSTVPVETLFNKGDLQIPKPSAWLQIGGYYT